MEGTHFRMFENVVVLNENLMSQCIKQYINLYESMLIIYTLHYLLDNL
jgi:hypothetical protein